MGAFVVYDPYWDPEWAFADKAEAEASCMPGQRFSGCHVIWKDDATPGSVANLPYVPPPWDPDSRD